MSFKHFGRASRLVVLGSLIAWQCCVGQGAASAGRTPFILDGNRMYAELGFVRPDGSIHRALAFVDMGTPSMYVAKSLLKELQVDDKTPLVFRVGTLQIEVPVTKVISQNQTPRSMGSELKVEGILPAGVLQNYQVVIDYEKRALTLAQSGALKPHGIPVPFHINEKTASGITQNRPTIIT